MGIAFWITFISSAVLLVAALVIFKYITRWRFKSIDGMRNLSDLDFHHEMLDVNGKLILDVREQSEVDAGYIPGAVHIPLGQLEQRLSELPKDKTIMIYCRGGVRSGKAGKILLAHGYPKLAHLYGGIEIWTGEVTRNKPDGMDVG